MTKILTALISLLAGFAIFIAVQGHGLFVDDAGMDDVAVPVRVVRPSDAESDAEAKRVGAKTMTASALAGETMAGHKHGAMSGMKPDNGDGTGAVHGHTKLDVSQSKSPPNLEISVVRDAMSGWNLKIVPSNFVFAPTRVNAKHILGEGHAHVYVNGVKLARVYGPHFHIPALEAGTHEIEVTLNTNSHEEYAIGEDRISRKVMITER